MAKNTRGLPSGFALNLPDDMPSVIGDYLDEPTPVLSAARRQPVAIPVQEETVWPTVDRTKAANVRPVREKVRSARSVRFQLNLNPQSKAAFEGLVSHIQTYSAEFDTRHSEVLQAIIAILDDCKEEMDLSALPRRGAWGSVSARNFVGSLSNVLEDAILKAAKKRR